MAIRQNNDMNDNLNRLEKFDPNMFVGTYPAPSGGSGQKKKMLPILIAVGVVLVAAVAVVILIVSSKNKTDTYDHGYAAPTETTAQLSGTDEKDEPEDDASDDVTETYGDDTSVAEATDEAPVTEDASRADDGNGPDTTEPDDVNAFGIYHPGDMIACDRYTAFVYCYERSVQDYVKMRCGPDKSIFAVAADKIANNTAVTVLSEDYRGWTLCSYDGSEGWVRSDFLFDVKQPVADKLFLPGESYYCASAEKFAFCTDTDVQDYVKLRFGPDKNAYNVAGRIDNNTPVTVLSNSCEGWTLCTVDGVKGWIRSDFLFDAPVGTAHNDEISVSFTPWESDKYTYIGATDASLGQIIAPSRGKLEKVGIVLYDNDGSELTSYSVAPTLEGNTKFYFEMNSEVHYTLKPGTMYRYRFSAEVGGRTYLSMEYAFKTKAND